MYQCPAILWSIVKLLIIVLIVSIVISTYVPYNTDITGEWQYEKDNKKIWLSRGWCGNYNIYDMDDDMCHIGTFVVDRMLNLDKYDLQNPSGSIVNISTRRFVLSQKNSKFTLRDGSVDGNIELTKK